MLDHSTATPDRNSGPDPSVVDRVIETAFDWLIDRQAPDGHWLFELEADATIPAEYIMLNHYLGTIDDEVEGKLARYLRKIQGDHGGWPLFHGGDFNISASVKAYYALKLAGDDIDAPHMAKAREAILAYGGAAKSNVFTRILLALFGELPWRATPIMRPEAFLLPSWSPFHMNKVSYWSRTVMAPLLILGALKPRAKNPRNVRISELFLRPLDRREMALLNPTGSIVGEVFLKIDAVAKLLEPLFPKTLERRGIERAQAFISERINGEDGLGAIFPAMAFAMMAFDALGYGSDHPEVRQTRRAIDGLLTFDGDIGYCQPCLSPIWDTGLAMHAALEAGLDPNDERVGKAVEWFAEREIKDVKGDWSVKRPDLAPGGWAFQYRNDHYPDVDDTAVIGMVLDRAGRPEGREMLDRAVTWIRGMQSKSGGWGAFDADNEHYLLNNIPFADHGALLDPPTADVSARCLSLLGQMGCETDDPTVAGGVRFLKDCQEEDGSWFGRWGTNYIYGTWSVLCALNAVGEDMDAPYIRRAVEWLKDRQREDGGWGEDCATYWDERKDEVKESTASQTAWALLGLMAAGEVESEAVRRGVEYLLHAPRDGGNWQETYFNAVGFPRVFYLKYHGYSAFFPLFALARFRQLTKSNAKRPLHGM